MLDVMCHHLCHFHTCFYFWATVISSFGSRCWLEFTVYLKNKKYLLHEETIYDFEKLCTFMSHDHTRFTYIFLYFNVDTSISMLYLP